MKTFLRTIVALVGLILVGAAVLYFTGAIGTVVIAIFKPHHGWDPALKAAAPDYSQASAWAARPGKPSPADLVPAGVAPAPSNPEADVFFIHPTGYLKGADWNSPIDPASQTEENTNWMMANQASAFNGCCAIYAPRYREASIFWFMADPPADVASKTMDLAYGDVDRAFSWFLAHRAADRPFIIASHSQGTWHALRLIRARIDGTPLADHMVAAYIIGGQITDKDVASLRSVHACASATDLHCIATWRTFGEGAPAPEQVHDKLLCINPLSWRRDGPRAPASQHKGGVPPSGRFQINFWGSDSPSGVSFTSLKAPVAASTWAECRDGRLIVADQKGGPFAGLDLGGKNYHGLDYPLFHMDIRENALARISAWRAAHRAAGP